MAGTVALRLTSGARQRATDAVTEPLWVRTLLIGATLAFLGLFLFMPLNTSTSGMNRNRQRNAKVAPISSVRNHKVGHRVGRPLPTPDVSRGELFSRSCD